ncbi:hypothetical protein SAMN05661044_01743 [Olivibacter domesticus]|uniref:Uncharacterized protein n=2 Tax=Olivibacter domesticus TaxID=407022 RepID=A0A1H7LQX5_OLID1|nr:hypothetical protein SAMN05661044_01743 [Olivibacter domesticus]
MIINLAFMEALKNVSKEKSMMDKFVLRTVSNWRIWRYLGKKPEKVTYCLYYRIYSFQLQSLWRPVDLKPKKRRLPFWVKTSEECDRPLSVFCEMLADINPKCSVESIPYQALLKHVEKLCGAEMDVFAQFAIAKLTYIDGKGELSIVFISQEHQLY